MGNAHTLLGSAIEEVIWMGRTTNILLDQRQPSIRLAEEAQQRGESNTSLPELYN